MHHHSCRDRRRTTLTADRRPSTTVAIYQIRCITLSGSTVVILEADHKRYLSEAFQHVIKERIYVCSSGCSIVPVCASRKHARCNGKRHCSAYCHYSLFSSVRSELTGSIADNRHYRGNRHNKETPSVYSTTAAVAVDGRPVYDVSYLPAVSS